VIVDSGCVLERDCCCFLHDVSNHMQKSTSESEVKSRAICP